jgi:hypothetical protein
MCVVLSSKPPGLAIKQRKAPHLDRAVNNRL